MKTRDTLYLTLDERHSFESLLAEYANAEMDLVRATGRRHNASHAIQDWVNARTARLATDAYHEGIASVHVAALDAAETAALEAQADAISSAPQVPTGTPYKLKPFHDAEIARGERHLKQDAPVGDCGCPTCCEKRALASIGSPSETAFDPPPMGQYSGN